MLGQTKVRLFDTYINVNKLFEANSTEFLLFSLKDAIFLSLISAKQKKVGRDAVALYMALN